MGTPFVHECVQSWLKNNKGSPSLTIQGAKLKDNVSVFLYLGSSETDEMDWDPFELQFLTERGSEELRLEIVLIEGHFLKEINWLLIGIQVPIGLLTEHPDPACLRHLVSHAVAWLAEGFVKVRQKKDENKIILELNLGQDLYLAGHATREEISQFLEFE